MVPEALPMMGVAQRQGAASDTAYDSSAVSILEQAMALGVVPSFRSGHPPSSSVACLCKTSHAASQQDMHHFPYLN